MTAADLASCDVRGFWNSRGSSSSSSSHERWCQVLSATCASGSYHTDPQTGPGACRQLLEGRTTNHRTGRNQASGTFSGTASSDNPYQLREQSAYLFWHTTKSDARAVLALCWELPEAPGVILLTRDRSTGCTSFPGDLSPSQRPYLRESPWCCRSLWPSRQGPSCPTDPLRLLGQPSSGISASQSSPG